MRMNWMLVLQIGGVAAVFLGSLLAVILIWNRKLAQESAERQKALEAARASASALWQRKQQLRSIVDNLPSLMMLKDSQARYIMANKFFETFTGYAESYVVGKNIADLLSPELAEQGMRLDKLVIETGKVHKTEEVRYDAVGEQHILDVVRVPLFEPDGTVYGMIRSWLPHCETTCPYPPRGRPKA